MTITEKINNIKFHWNESVTDAIIYELMHGNTFNGTCKDFLSHCTACGGDWGAMLLTGINELWPKVYEAIPDDMGLFAWPCIINTIECLGVKMSEA